MIQMNERLMKLGIWVTKRFLWFTIEYCLQMTTFEEKIEFDTYHRDPKKHLSQINCLISQDDWQKNDSIYDRM